MSRARAEAPAGSTAAPGAGRGLLVVALAVLAVWLWVTVPLAAGQRSLFFRDVLDNHFALKTFGAAELARGEIPAFNPTLGLGQPFRGNPSALAFYPGNALYLLLPFWSAFNLHFALHWLLALVAMALLARRLGMGAHAALFAGVTYAGSGWFLSTLSFYNLVGVAAWWPLAMAGAVAPPQAGRSWPLRGIALGGVACGMALLAGEPMTAALGMVPLALLAIQRHGVWRGLVVSGGVGALGLALAAPQVVATARILGFSLRGSAGVAGLVTHFSLPPIRLAELVLPLPFGWPLDLGPHGWWLWRTAPDAGFYLSLYAGIVGLWMALRGARRRHGWAALALTGLAGAMVLQAAPDLVARLTGGLFRYPEKLLVWYALALPLLAARGVESALREEPAPGTAAAPPGQRDRVATAPRGPLPRGAVVAGCLLVAAAVGVAFAWPWLATGSPIPRIVAAQSSHLMAYLAGGGILLLAGAAALRRRAGAVLVLLQVVALLQLHPLIRTVDTEPLSEPSPWNQRLGVAEIGRGPAVFNTFIPRPTWEPILVPADQEGSRAARELGNALDLYPAPGVAFGLTYPLAPNIEGLAASLHTLAVGHAQTLDWPQRLTWLRLLGTEAVVTHQPVSLPGFRLLDRHLNAGVPSFLYAVEGTAPAAWWPRSVEAADGPRQAFERISELADPVATVVAARAVEHDPGGRVERVSETADRLVIEVTSGEGGLLVVRRAFHPLYGARSGERPLPLMPAAMTLIGVVVPPGEHRVVVAVDDAPETWGGVVSLLALLGIAGLTWRGGRQPIGSAPAEVPARSP